MLQEVSFINEGYMYTATLTNGDTIYVFDNGTGRGMSGKMYKLISHVDQYDNIIIDGWKEI